VLAVLLVLELAACYLAFRREGVSSPEVVGNFFSYFTIQTTLLVIATLTILLSVQRQSAGWQYLRGAVTSYLVITFVVYEFVLSPNPLDLTGDLPDTVMHVLAPLVVLGVWVLRPPARPIQRVLALGWLSYPVAYVGYTLLRGRVAHWYPYYFLDPTLRGGYLRVAACVAILLAAATGAVLAVAQLSRRRPR
jgi:hypothetical protein